MPGRRVGSKLRTADRATSWRRTAAVVAVTVAAAAATSAAAPAAAEPWLLWSATYGGEAGSYDVPSGVVVTGDAAYVATSSTGFAHPREFGVLRYGLDGTLDWQAHIGGDEQHIGAPTDVAAHPGGGVVITGRTGTADTPKQVTTARVTPDGTVLWVREHAITAPFGLDPPRLAIAADGTTYVSATTAGEFLVATYALDGTAGWERTVDVFDEAPDSVSDIAVDGGGIAYAVGRAVDAQLGFATLALDASGDTLWSRTVAGTTQATLGPAQAAVAPSGGVVVSADGRSACGAHQALTWRVDVAGELLWSATHPEHPCADARPVEMAVRADGSVAVLLEERSADAAQADLAVLSYAPDGELEWHERYGTANADLPAAIAVDASGIAYVAGVLSLDFADNDIVTVSYARTGRLRWAGRLDTGTRVESATDLALTPGGSVAVTGSDAMPGEEPDFDVLTMLYRQPPWLSSNG